MECDAGRPPPSLFGLISPRSNSSSVGGRGAAVAQRLQAWLSSSSHEDDELLEKDDEAGPSVAVASFLCVDPAFRLGHGLPNSSPKHPPPLSSSTVAAVRAAMTKVPQFMKKRRHETASGATFSPYELDPSAAEAFLGAFREEVRRRYTAGSSLAFSFPHQLHLKAYLCVKAQSIRPSQHRNTCVSIGACGAPARSCECLA